MAANVLVIDDDPGFRSLAVQLLERTGLRVTREADTVERAREVVHEVRPAFVLLDVSLPDGDGVALAGELTELPWRPRVVLISSDRAAASAAELDQSNPAAVHPQGRTDRRRAAHRVCRAVAPPALGLCRGKSASRSSR